MALIVRDLCIQGPDGTILDGIGLSVARGEIVGLQGPSGVGKSLLLACIAGLLPPGVRQTAGRVDVPAGPVGWAMQDASDALDPRRRIAAELRVTLAANGRARAPAWWCDAVGLTVQQAARLPADLSGGQRQRAVLALAMSVEPKLLLADEPTGSLDPAARDRVGALLRDVARDGSCGVLLVSHDSRFLADVADRIVLLSDGRLPGPLRPAGPPGAAAPKQDEPLLRLVGVSFSRGAARLLDGVSLEVAPGRTLAMVGPSGSGKTTAARIAAGLLPPAAGHVVRGGRVAMVFQDAYGSLDPFWSAGRSIAEPLPSGMSRGQRRQEVARLLRDVALPETVAAVRPGRLSGGQRQLVAIARALAARPALLVCDEPTSALDARTRRTILELLCALQARDGFGMLLASHDPETIEALAHDVRRMENGRLLPAAEVR